MDDIKTIVLNLPVQDRHRKHNFVVLFDPTLEEVVNTAKVLKKTFIYIFLTKGSVDEVCLTWGKLVDCLDEFDQSSKHYVVQPDFVPGINHESLTRLVKERIGIHIYHPEPSLDSLSFKVTEADRPD